MSFFLPRLSEARAAREMISAFRGYNHTPSAGADEWYDMRNLSSRDYPTAVPRRPRRLVRKLDAPGGLFARDKLAWVDGTDFYYDGIIRGQVTNGEKQFVAMGAYVLIWPDKLSYNTKTGEMETLEARVTTAGAVTYDLCKADGTAIEAYAAGPTAPADPANGDMWVDTSADPHVLRQYATVQGMWVSVPTTYVRIGAAGIGEGFTAGDGVKIEGSEIPALNGDMLLVDAGADYLVVTAIIGETTTQDTALTVKREAPDMEYLTECRNRVWGCSSTANEIYACKLGDPKNWRVYAGLSTDSYAATIGTAGAFTGACTHLGYVLFFKAGVIHKLYGFEPSNFEITDVQARGVAPGSEKSLVVVNERLYYKSRTDVCMYEGALPYGVSAALGQEPYRDAVAGAAGGRYYVSMQDAAGGWRLLAFDDARGLWHLEDETRIMAFAAMDGVLYGLRADGWLMTMDGSASPYDGPEAKAERSVEWMAETGDIGVHAPNKKTVTRIQLRLDVGLGALVRVMAQYDRGPWVEVQRINPSEGRNALVPIIPHRCDTMRIRLIGTGECRIHAMSKAMREGSAL